jgi:hypothetical protein
MTARGSKYVDHLHEHFVDPCVVRDGAYVPPAAPGYSAQMHADSLATYAFPTGTYWASRAVRRTLETEAAGQAAHDLDQARTRMAARLFAVEDCLRQRPPGNEPVPDP